MGRKGLKYLLNFNKYRGDSTVGLQGRFSKIYTSWSTPLCLLGSIQILQLAVNEHKNGLQNDVDEDDAGDTATTDVAIAINDDAAPLVMTTMKGKPVSIAMTMTTTILLTTAPANVTISWTMTTNKVVMRRRGWRWWRWTSSSRKVLRGGDSSVAMCGGGGAEDDMGRKSRRRRRRQRGR